VDVSKRHACHATCWYMSPSATRATQKAAAPTATPENHARRRSQPDAIRVTPATQKGSRCIQVPHLPRETKVDVSKCHTCHAKCSYCHLKCSYMSPSAMLATRKPAAPTAIPENQAHHQSQPNAIRTRHAKWKSMCPNMQPATPSTPTAAVRLYKDDKLCQLKTNICGQIV